MLGRPICLTRSCGFVLANKVKDALLWSLSSAVFEGHTSTGSELFSLLMSLDATIFVLPSVFILIETICPKFCSKPRLKSAKSPLPFNMRRSNTSLLKLPIGIIGQPWHSPFNSLSPDIHIQILQTDLHAFP